MYSVVFSYGTNDGVAERRGLSFGIGVSGLLSALAAYFAFDFGLLKGPMWRNLLVVVLIGGGAGLLAIGLDRALRRDDSDRPGGPVKLKGPWACPTCGAAYVPEAKECSDCHVPLVESS